MPAATAYNFADLFFFSRASRRSAFDASGNLIELANNQPCFDYDPATLKPLGLRIEPLSANHIRNPRAEGGAVGGSAPTNWSITGSASPVTREVVGLGVENGIPYVDYRFVSAGISAGVAIEINFETSTGIAGVAGDQMVLSVFARLLSGTIPNSGNAQLAVSCYDAGPSFLGVASSSALAITAAPLATQRFAAPLTVSLASTQFVRPLLRVLPGTGAAFDFTLRVGCPQLEKGLSTPTSIILPTVGTPAVSARVGESCRIDMTKIGFANSGSSLVIAATPVDSAGGLWRLDDSTNDNYLYPYITGATLRTRARTGAGEEINRLINNTVPYGQEFVLRSTFTSGSSRHSLNGGAVVSHAMDALPLNLNRLYIGGGWVGGGYPFWGTIRRFDIIPRVATDAELPTLSA